MSGAVLKLPVRRRASAWHEFQRPADGPERFCGVCGKTVHCHKRFANVSCSACGESFGPGNHGFSSCDEHGGKGAA